MKAGTSQSVFMRDGWKCRHCNNRAGLHPHHIVYRSAGGTDTMDNLVTLCWICHRAVHDGFLTCERHMDKVVFERLRGWKP